MFIDNSHTNPNYQICTDKNTTGYPNIVNNIFTPLPSNRNNNVYVIIFYDYFKLILFF